MNALDARGMCGELEETLEVLEVVTPIALDLVVPEVGLPLEAAEVLDEALAAADSEETVSLYHGSINDFTSIAENGLDPGRVPTWVTTDLEAAQNAIDPTFRVGSMADPGIIESRIPSSVFNDTFQGARPYPGFYGANLNSSEIVLHSPAEISVFNQYIVP